MQQLLLRLPPMVEEWLLTYFSSSAVLSCKLGCFSDTQNIHAIHLRHRTASWAKELPKTSLQVQYFSFVSATGIQFQIFLFLRVFMNILRNTFTARTCTPQNKLELHSPWALEWSLLFCSSPYWLQLFQPKFPSHTDCSHRWKHKAISTRLPCCMFQISGPERKGEVISSQGAQTASMRL